MRCILVGPAAQTWYPALLMESADEHWRCVQTEWLCGNDQPEVLVLFPGMQSEAALRRLQADVPVCAPWVAACGWQSGMCDLCLDMQEIGFLPERIGALERAGAVPRLCHARLPQMTEDAERLLRALEIRPGLGAWQFLPEMVALGAAHPLLLTHMTSVLYPLMASRCSLRPSAIERRLRIAVESAWSTSPLTSLDHYFGQSIDPEKGKPTNREFLCQMAEHVRSAARV